MNFLLNILSNVFNRFISTPGSKSKDANNTDTNAKISRVENTSAIIMLVCAISLAFYWIPQYIVADVFWIKQCIAQNQLVAFPIKADELFEMIYSLLGLGTLGFIHKLVRRFK